MGSTVGRADIYGLPSGGSPMFEPFTVLNPNGGTVAPPASQTASGGALGTDNQAAGGLVGIIVAVVLLRILIHAFGSRA